MATIDKKLIHFNRKADFEARLAAGEIRDYSIVCIKDAKLIWTHGQYYGDLSECLRVTEQTLTDAEKAQVLGNLGIEIPAKVSELENDSSFVSAVDTGEEVDDVEVNYVTEAELTSGLAKKQDKLVSGTNIKTINGTSILGSGDIVVEGGLSSGGEDIRHFTNFTVETFISRAIDRMNLWFDANAVIEAARANKLICVPYEEYEKGYVVASYKFNDGEENSLTLNLTISVNGAEYTVRTIYYYDEYLYRFRGETYKAYLTQIEEVETYDGEAYIEAMDNTIYYILGPVTYLAIYGSELAEGATVRFTTGDDFILESPESTMWPNGTVPTTEPYTFYELSLSTDMDGTLNAVLIPFKPV